MVRIENLKMKKPEATGKLPELYYNTDFKWAVPPKKLSEFIKKEKNFDKLSIIRGMFNLPEFI
jgi:hypothetical protein